MMVGVMGVGVVVGMVVSGGAVVSVGTTPAFFSGTRRLEQRLNAAVYAYPRSSTGWLLYCTTVAFA